jgi:methionine-rich copper-binding protein CopC
VKNVVSRSLPANTRKAFLTAWALTALALVFWTAPGALGHNVVQETTPEPGSTVTDSPVDIRIVTNDQLLDLGGTGSGFAIVVRNAEGLYYGDGCVTIGETDISSTADLGGAGDYTVTYQFVSADGHSLSDSFSFSFAPDSSHSPARGFPDPPVCGVESGLVDAPVGQITEATPGESVVAVPILEEIADDQPERGLITLAIATVLVVLSITLLVWMVKRKSGN